MIVICPCGVSVPRAQINQETKTAVCQKCNAVIDLSEQISSSSFAAKTPAKPAEKLNSVIDPKISNLVLPASWSVTSQEGGCVITYSWLERFMFHEPLIALVLGGVAVLFCVQLFSKIAAPAEYVPVLFILLVALFFAYKSLANLLNTTDVKVIRRELIITHKPLRWLNEKRLPASDLKDFAIDSEESNRVYEKRTYRLYGITQSGKSIYLVGNLASKKNAMLLAVALADLMDINPEASPRR